MRKRGLLLGLCIAAAIFTAGCSGRSGSSEDKSGAKAAVSEEAEKTEPAGDSAETEAPGEETEQEKQVTGVIKSFTGGYLSVVDESGKTLGFDLGDAVLECENGVLSGDEVTVVYREELDEFNVETAEVLRVSDAEGKKELAESTLTGYVANVTSDTLKVQMTRENAEDAVLFFTVGTEFRCKNGLGPDDPVTVTYKGEIQSNNARSVKVISVTDGAEEKENPDGEEHSDKKDQSAGEPVETDATLVDVDGTILTVEPEGAAEGETCRLDCSAAEISLKYGLLKGIRVSVKYEEGKGEDAVCPLLSIKDAASDGEEEADGFSIPGTVMAVGQNTLTLTSDEGAQITCSIEDVELDSAMDGIPGEGAYVVVTIEPSAESNVYRALRLSPAY